jgi:hypothetical protein
MHEHNEVVDSICKRPRGTSTNKSHIKQVWGSEYEKRILIPKVIDDYNMWMLGVDRADQLIAYYRPDLRCRRTWMPLFLQGLMIIQVNAFISFKVMTNAPKFSHKSFLMAFIDGLMVQVREHAFPGVIPRNTLEQEIDQRKKRKRTSSTKPTLPVIRFDKPIELHVRVSLDKATTTPQACVYCSYERILRKNEGEDERSLPRPKRVVMICNYCDVRLCKDHFEVFHDHDESEKLKNCNKTMQINQQECLFFSAFLKPLLVALIPTITGYLF